MDYSRCSYCHKLMTSSLLNRHISASKGCRRQWEKTLTLNEPKPPPQNRPEKRPTSPCAEHNDNFDMAIFDFDGFEPGRTSANPSKRARVEDADDDERRPTSAGSQYIEPYPRPVGTPLRYAKTKFDLLRKEQERRNENNWTPFKNEEEWQLARWLSAQVGHTAIDE